MQNAVKQRKIECLFHFTRLDNVSSILSSGIIPRAQLEAQGARVTYNDELRLDRQRDATCLSIGHPNYKFFYRLRQMDTSQKWVVMAIDSRVLWEKRCAFCHENAASNNVTGIPLLQRMGVQAFNRMFDQVANKPSRANINLPDNCPTNPQAEVLVFDVIESGCISAIVTPNKNIEDNLKARHPGFNILTHLGPFSPRFDYGYW